MAKKKSKNKVVDVTLVCDEFSEHLSFRVRVPRGGKTEDKCRENLKVLADKVWEEIMESGNFHTDDLVRDGAL